MSEKAVIPKGGQLKIHLFGSFRISDEDQTPHSFMHKGSKMWSLLKYLIANSGKPVSADQLIDVLWSDEDSGDPAKVQRDAVYRLRRTLNTFGGERQYIIYSKGNYSWNNNLDCWIDLIEFDKNLRIARDVSLSDEERIKYYFAAISLYEGPFLNDSTLEMWVHTFTNYYRRLFLQIIGELSDLYEKGSLLEERIALFDKAVECEPYEEALYIRQIETLIECGEYSWARRQYRQFEKILMREFGTKPSKNLERLYFEIEKATSNRAGSLQEITQHLEDGNKKRGPIFCGPETFRQIYILDKRADERVQFPIFLCLITINGKDDEELKEAMRALRQVLLGTLRNGDVITQYSQCQFILMLTALNEANGRAAFRRIQFLFEAKFGAGKVEVACQLSPLEKVVPEESGQKTNLRKLQQELS